MLEVNLSSWTIIAFVSVIIFFLCLKILVWFANKKKQYHCKHNFIVKETSNNWWDMDTIFFCKKCGKNKVVKH